MGYYNFTMNNTMYIFLNTIYYVINRCAVERYNAGFPMQT